MSYGIEDLERLYGFRWPIEVAELASVASALSPDAPSRAFEAIGLTLVGPFDALWRRLDAPAISPLLHWRFEHDPPELFTVMLGDSDHVHWGYWIDVAPADALHVAEAAPGEPEITPVGPSLRAAIVARIARVRADHALVPDRALDVGRLDALDAALGGLRARDAAARGASSLLDHRALSLFGDATIDTMGLVVHATQRTAQSLARRERAKSLQIGVRAADFRTQAQRALAAGKPGDALAFARDLWTADSRTYGRVASELAVAAYGALRRPLLERVARAHGAARRLPRVDITSYDDDALRALLDDGVIDEPALARPLTS